jgi:acetoin utilization deacetylase AcuC-like enzyme
LPRSLTEARSGPSGWRATISELVIPALKNFQPELLLVSAGFDGLSTDPLGRKMGLSPEDYTWATKQLVKASQEMDSCNGECGCCLCIAGPEVVAIARRQVIVLVVMAILAIVALC